MAKKHKWLASWNTSKENDEEERQPFLKETPSSDAEWKGTTTFSVNSSASTDVETLQNLPKERRYKFLFLVLLTLFIAESSRGMVVATLYIYLQKLGADDYFIGIVVAVFSVGRMVGGFVFGFHYNKRGAKEALAVAIVFSIIGNIMFAIGEDKWILMAARTLVGFGTGILSVVRACISAATTKDERSRYFAYSGAVQFMGFAIVPGVSVILTKINFSVWKITVNEFNSAGYILAIANIVVLIIIITTFLDIPPGLDKDSTEDNKPKNLRYYLGVALFIFLNFVGRGVIALLETVGAPEFLAAWHAAPGKETRDTSLMFLILGCVGLVVFFVIPYVLKVVSEKKVLFFGFLIVGAGGVVLIQFTHDNITLAQFISGAALIWSIGNPIVQTIVMSAFSKMLGSKPQGLWMGLMTAAGSLGRIFFPLFATVAPRNVNFIISSSSALLSAILILFF